MQDPDNIEEITKLTDALVDRQMQRLYGSLSKIKPSGTGGTVPDIASMITGRGGISGKKVMGFLINRFLQGKMGSEEKKTGLP